MSVTIVTFFRIDNIGKKVPMPFPSKNPNVPCQKNNYLTVVLISSEYFWLKVEFTRCPPTPVGLALAAILTDYSQLEELRAVCCDPSNIYV
jgi:hypothetical protein